MKTIMFTPKVVEDKNNVNKSLIHDLLPLSNYQFVSGKHHKTWE